MHSRKWTDKNDVERLVWEVTIDNIYFGESKKAEKTEFVEITEEDGDLPF